MFKSEELRKMFKGFTKILKKKQNAKNKNCEYKVNTKNDGECCRLMPVYDPETNKMLGCLACEVISDEHCKKLKNKTERDLGKLHAEAEVPHPLMLDEVSASFISWLRVSSWEDLGKEFGGYKIGRILAYILDLICAEIEDSTAAISEELKHYYFYPAIKSLKEIKNLICNPAGAKTEMELMKNQHERLNKIYKLACEGLGEEVPECQ